MPNTDWLKVIAASRQSSVSFREGGEEKSEMADRDVLLRKTRDKLCDFPVSFEGRPARCSEFCIRWPRCPRCLSYGIQEEFDFPILCNCGRNGTRETSNRVGFLSIAEHHQQPDFRGQKLASSRLVFDGVDICKLSTTTWFSRKGVLEERLLNFLTDKLHFIQSRRCFSVTMTSRFEKVDEKYIQELKANGESENTKNSAEW